MSDTYTSLMGEYLQVNEILQKNLTSYFTLCSH